MFQTVIFLHKPTCWRRKHHPLSGAESRLETQKFSHGGHCKPWVLKPDLVFNFSCCMCFCASTTNSAFACGSVLPLLLLSVPVGFVLPLPFLKLVMFLCYFWPLLQVLFCPSIIISSIACVSVLPLQLLLVPCCFCAFYVHLCHLHCLVGV